MLHHSGANSLKDAKMVTCKISSTNMVIKIAVLVDVGLTKLQVKITYNI